MYCSEPRSRHAPAWHALPLLGHTVFGHTVFGFIALGFVVFGWQPRAGWSQDRHGGSRAMEYRDRYGEDSREYRNNSYRNNSYRDSPRPDTRVRETDRDTAPRRRRSEREPDRSVPRKETTLSGRVVSTKLVDLRGDEDQEFVALVETSHGARQIVDLGPVSELRASRPRTGDRISVVGRRVPMGRFEVLMARRLSHGDRWVDIRRPEKQVEEADIISRQTRQVVGRVIETYPFQAAASRDEHLMVRLRDSAGRTHFIDMGDPARLPEANLEVNQQILVQGRDLLIDNRNVLVAFRLRTDNATYLIRPRDRWANEEPTVGYDYPVYSYSEYDDPDYRGLAGYERLELNEYDLDLDDDPFLDEDEGEFDEGFNPRNRLQSHPRFYGADPPYIRLSPYDRRSWPDGDEDDDDYEWYTTDDRFGLYDDIYGVPYTYGYHDDDDDEDWYYDYHTDEDDVLEID